MSNRSVPHSLRVVCAMSGRPQTYGVRVFPPLQQKKVARMMHEASSATSKPDVHQEVAR